jgi:hypothetical protein
MCSICGVMLQLRFQTTVAMDVVLGAVVKSSFGQSLSSPSGLIEDCHVHRLTP